MFASKVLICAVGGSRESGAMEVRLGRVCFSQNLRVLSKSDPQKNVDIVILVINIVKAVSNIRTVAAFWLSQKRLSKI